MEDAKVRTELPACPVETTLSLIGDKWKVLILRDLMPGTKRFGELKKSVGNVSQKVLTAQLRAMEGSGLASPPAPGGLLPDAAWTEPEAHIGGHVGLGESFPAIIGTPPLPGGGGKQEEKCAYTRRKHLKCSAFFVTLVRHVDIRFYGQRKASFRTVPIPFASATRR